jgi:hypothetical protein
LELALRTGLGRQWGLRRGLIVHPTFGVGECVTDGALRAKHVQHAVGK